jgi:hypothetical protein
MKTFKQLIAEASSVPQFDEDQKYAEADDDKTATTILDKLASDPNPYVRERVARNPKTLAKTLEKIAKNERGKDEEVMIGLALVDNPNISTVALKILMTYRDKDIVADAKNKMIFDSRLEHPDVP